MQNKTLDSSGVIDLCPTDRELAALLDGALEATKAEEVRQHILVCPACYSVYVDAIRFELDRAPGVATLQGIAPFEWPASAAPQEAEQVPAPILHLAPPPAVAVPAPPVGVQASSPMPAPPAAPGAMLVPSRRDRRRLERFPWLRTAAGLVLAAVSAFMFWPKTYERPELSAATLMPASTTSSATLAAVEASRRSRGPESSLTDEPLLLKSRLGALMADIHVAARQGDQQKTLTFVQDLYRAMLPLGTLNVEAQSLLGITERLRDRTWNTSDVTELDGVIGSVRDGERQRGRAYLDLGQWCEAGRLAAATSRPDFFSVPESQGFLKWLLHQGPRDEDSVALSPTAEKLLKEIDKQWPRAAGAIPAYDLLKANFDGLAKEFSPSQTGS